MNRVPLTKGPIPESFKTRTREEFLAQKSASLTGDDLYWLLYRAAVDAPNSSDAFSKEVNSLLDARLGAGSYTFTLSMSPNSGGGSFDYENGRLPNSQAWGGDAGVLPGFGRNVAIICVVFWG